jgi:hypothetical protein
MSAAGIFTCSRILPLGTSSCRSTTQTLKWMSLLRSAATAAILYATVLHGGAVFGQGYCPICPQSSSAWTQGLPTAGSYSCSAPGFSSTSVYGPPEGGLLTRPPQSPYFLPPSQGLTSSGSLLLNGGTNLRRGRFLRRRILLEVIERGDAAPEVIVREIIEE